MTTRNRIVRFTWLTAGEIRRNTLNPAPHAVMGPAVRDALRREVGLFEVHTVYHSARNDGALTLLRGDVPRDPTVELHCAVTDLTDVEADEILAVELALAALRHTDKRILLRLLEGVRSGEWNIQTLVATDAEYAQVATLEPIL